MTTDEWMSKSDDWHKGWRYGQGDVFIEKRDSRDFIDGWRYAIAHPIGPVAIPQFADVPHREQEGR